MCMPSSSGAKSDSGYIEIKPKKHIQRVSKDIFEKGDPDFLDERNFENEQGKAKKSFFALLFGE